MNPVGSMGSGPRPTVEGADRTDRTGSDGWSDRRSHGQTDRWTVARTVGRIGGRTEGRMDSAQASDEPYCRHKFLNLPTSGIQG
jgi:hypothetical protein